MLDNDVSIGLTPYFDGNVLKSQSGNDKTG